MSPLPCHSRSMFARDPAIPSSVRTAFRHAFCRDTHVFDAIRAAPFHATGGPLACTASSRDPAVRSPCACSVERDRMDHRKRPASMTLVALARFAAHQESPPETMRVVQRHMWQADRRRPSVRRCPPDLRAWVPQGASALFPVRGRAASLPAFAARRRRTGRFVGCGRIPGRKRGMDRDRPACAGILAAGLPLVPSTRGVKVPSWSRGGSASRRMGGCRAPCALRVAPGVRGRRALLCPERAFGVDAKPCHEGTGRESEDCVFRAPGKPHEPAAQALTFFQGEDLGAAFPQVVRDCRNPRQRRVRAG